MNKEPLPHKQTQFLILVKWVTAARVFHFRFGGFGNEQWLRIHERQLLHVPILNDLWFIVCKSYFHRQTPDIFFSFGTFTESVLSRDSFVLASLSASFQNLILKKKDWEWETFWNSTNKMYGEIFQLVGCNVTHWHFAEHAQFLFDQPFVQCLAVDPIRTNCKQFRNQEEPTSWYLFLTLFWNENTNIKLEFPKRKTETRINFFSREMSRLSLNSLSLRLLCWFWMVFRCLLNNSVHWKPQDNSKTFGNWVPRHFTISSEDLCFVHWRGQCTHKTQWSTDKIDGKISGQKPSQFSFFFTLLAAGFSKLNKLIDYQSVLEKLKGWSDSPVVVWFLEFLTEEWTHCSVLAIRAWVFQNVLLVWCWKQVSVQVIYETKKKNSFVFWTAAAKTEERNCLLHDGWFHSARNVEAKVKLVLFQKSWEAEMEERSLGPGDMHCEGPPVFLFGGEVTLSKVWLPSTWDVVQLLCDKSIAAVTRVRTLCPLWGNRLGRMCWLLRTSASITQGCWASWKHAF